MMVDRSFGDTVCTFIAENTFVTWDPNEFNIKRIQGKEKVINMTAE